MSEIGTLERLAATIAARRSESADKSYTRQLLDAGPEKCAKKFGEEAVETIQQTADGHHRHKKQTGGSGQYAHVVGKLIPLDIKVGDKVLFGKYSGQEFKMEGQDLLHMREDDIIGIVG